MYIYCTYMSRWHLRIFPHVFLRRAFICISIDIWSYIHFLYIVCLRFSQLVFYACKSESMECQKLALAYPLPPGG